MPADKRDLVRKGLSRPWRVPGYVLSQARMVLDYLVLRARHGDPDSIEFYADLQDRKVARGHGYPRGKGIGPAQVEFLRNHGVDPDDVVLDLGCGDLRGGRYTIEYLDPGNYYGTDISAEAIRRAWEHVSEHGLEEQYPVLVVNPDLTFRQFDRRFDVVFANSVFTHLSAEHVEECFAHVGDVLREDGVLFASFADLDSEEIADTPASYTRSVRHSNHYRHSRSFFRQLGEEYGFEVEFDPYEEHPGGKADVVVARPA